MALKDVDVSINDLKHFRSRVLREKRGLTGREDDTKRDLLDNLREAIERRQSSIAREQGRQDVWQKLQDAHQFHRQNIDKFTTRAGERILRKRNRAYQVSNAQVIREFLKTPEDAAQFVDGIGNRQDALEAIESYLDADLYLKAVNPDTGRLKLANAQKFLRDRHGMMRMFPELRERYGDLAALERKAQRVEDASKRLSQRATRRVSESEELAETQERAANAQASVQLQQQRLAREPGQAVLQATLDNGGIAQIMGRHGDANTQLIRLADTMEPESQARQGIARSMWQEFLRREGQRAGRDQITDNPVINDRELTNFLKKYNRTFAHIYGPEHVANLRQVAEGLRITRSADRPPISAGSPTAELLQGRTGILQGAMKAAMPPFVPLGNAKLRVLLFAWRTGKGFLARMKNEQLETITREMLFDPDVSKTFAMLRDPKQAKQAGARLKAHMLMLGAENRFDDPDGDE